MTTADTGETGLHETVLYYSTIMRSPDIYAYNTFRRAGKVAVTLEYVNTPLAKVMDTPFPSGIESIFYFTDVTRASPGVQASS